MAISIVILILGGDLGDKRTVAFGATTLYEYRIFNCKCGNERLVSHSWCRKMMKAGIAVSRPMWLNYFKKTAKRESVQWHAYAWFCLRGRLLCIYRGTHRVGNSAVSPRKFFPRLAASQSPSKIWRAAAAGKIATRRLISRIILQLVVNASSRRRRGLLCAVCISGCSFYILSIGCVLSCQFYNKIELNWIHALAIVSELCNPNQL